MKPKAKVVPFRRELRQGSRGGDVVAVKRALSKAGYMKWGPFTRLFGPFAVRALKKFQTAHHLRADGIYALATHRALAPSFDGYGAWLIGSTPQRSGDDDVRARIVAAMTVLYHHREQVHYTMTAKRMQGVREKLRPPRFPQWEDCSSSSTWAYWIAGAPDPNALGYNGQGWTGTLCQHGRHISLDQAQPGDLVFYGPGAPWHHVAVYIGHGRVLSHGSEAGPFLLPVDYRSDRGDVRTYPLK